MTTELTAERLKELLSYDPETGIFTCLVARGPVRVGDLAGTIGVEGYRIICINRRLYRASRLAWLYMTGAWPRDQVDHKNTLRWDDRWLNLRAADHSQNNMNKKGRADSRSGLKGVSWCGRHKKWIARIMTGGVMRRIGIFADAQSAHQAYVRAAEISHGKFARAS